MVSSFFLSRVLRCRWCCGVLLFCVCFAGEGGGGGGGYDYWGSVDALFYFEKAVECGGNVNF